MAIVHYTTSFRTLKGNHKLLRKLMEGPYQIHHWNGFIKATGPKWVSQPLTQEQKQSIRQKVKDYTRQEYQRIFRTSVFTLVASAFLLYLFAELWKWIH